MKASNRFKVLCGNIWMKRKLGYLGNKIDMAKVGKFGDRTWDIIVYTKFGHMLDALMGIVSKALMDEFIKEIISHDIYIC